MSETLAVPALPKPRAVLFDWDNTLVDNWRSIHQAVNDTLAAMGLPGWSLEQTRQRARRSARDSFPRLFGDRWRDAEKIFYDSFAKGHLNGLRAMPRADDMLRDLAALRLCLGVVSNKKGTYLRREAAHLGWTDIFNKLVGATDASADKPAAAPVELALEGSGLVPGPDVWFVGDTEIDMECAHNARCTAVLMAPEPTAGAEMPVYPPAIRISGCVELGSLVNAMVNEQ